MADLTDHEMLEEERSFLLRSLDDLDAEFGDGNIDDETYVRLRADYTARTARVLQRLGSRRVMIVHGLEGLDELSISGPTMVGELKDGQIREYMVAPADVGLKSHNNNAIRVESVEQSKDMLLGALENKPDAARDIVALNAGASIYVAGLAGTLVDGVKRALAVIDSGAARQKLDQFVAFTKSHG